MKKILLSALFLIAGLSQAQELTGNQLLEKAIEYHDPNNRWSTFNGKLQVIMKTPGKPERISDISINLPQEYFKVKATRGENTTTYTLDKDNCEIAFNGKTELSEALKEEHNLSCDRAKLYKNYYTYLYGLPMKLKDKGTNLASKVTRKTFKGKEYLVLKVTYDEIVGKDTWYFYFNPTTYAMEVYQFFKKTKDSGEYILLTEEEEINGIKFPKNRAWYYNKDDKYLGTDYLSKK